MDVYLLFQLSDLGLLKFDIAPEVLHFGYYFVSVDLFGVGKEMPGQSLEHWIKI